MVDGAREIGLGEEHRVEPVDTALMAAVSSVPRPPNSAGGNPTHALLK